jgi:hypothetical protein
MKLKLFLTVILSSVYAHAALANNGLATVMDDMATNTKAIAKQASDATQNAASEALCDKVVADITQAENFTPDAVAKLPAGQQAAAQQGYVTLLGQLSDQFATLKADFAANDNTAAVAELAVINTTKADGHKQFQ